MEHRSQTHIFLDEGPGMRVQVASAGWVPGGRWLGPGGWGPPGCRGRRGRRPRPGVGLQEGLSCPWSWLSFGSFMTLQVCFVFSSPSHVRHPYFRALTFLPGRPLRGSVLPCCVNPHRELMSVKLFPSGGRRPGRPCRVGGD